MDFSWTKEQSDFKQAVIDFARRDLSAGVIERDWRGELAHENWLKCARFGIQGLPFPERYGGAGLDILTTTLMMEGLGYGCRDNGLIFGINAQMWSVQMPILHFGSEAQKEKYLPGLISGTLIGAHGMSEPESGSDAYSMHTRAERCEEGYRLNGSKTFVTNAPVADLAVVFASTAPERGMWGISAFIVEKGTPGFTVGADIKKMGLRTSPMGELIFQDCLLPLESRLGPEGAGSQIFNDSMEWERSAILASHIGGMEHQLERCVAYAQEREQFGKPIGSFQAVSGRIVEMKVRLETARLLLYRVAWLKSVNRSAVLEAALAKLYLSEAFVQSGLDAIKTFGGYGYTTEYEVERDLRDAIGGMLYSGTSDIQRNIIASLMGL